MVINLHPDNCKMYADWKKFISGHSGIATIDLNGYLNFDDYIARGYSSTARNLWRRTYREGYYSRVITMEERNDRLKEIDEINQSKAHRQGREMSAGYRTPAQAYTGARTCEHHYGEWFGGFNQDGKLIAYINGNFCGEMSASSQILGHWDYLKSGIMYQLWGSFIRESFERKMRYVIYHLMDSGTPGLQLWKRAVGLKPTSLQFE